VTIWGLAGAAYGLVFAAAALTQPIRRPHVAVAASLAFTLVSVAAASLADDFWINLLVPGALLLGGYWLSGLFFRDPQPWLERWLLRVDHAVGAERWMDRVPRPVAELLELSYAMDYVVVGGGAIYAAAVGTDAVAHYWSLVLASELASFAPMPWLRSRPPRAVEGWSPDEAIGARPAPRAEGPPAAEPPTTQSVAFRRLNTFVLDGASIQANTLPSGHVSGAVAAALGIMAVDVVAGWWLMGAAGLIAVAAVAGRYHYLVDCVSGAAVAFMLWTLM
jgi:hypothetical protein